MGNSLAYAPPRPRSQPSVRATHRLRIDNGDNVPAYYGRSSDARRPVLLFCHGNSDDLDHVVEHVGGELAARLNTALYVFEYPGYAGTRGPTVEPSETAIYQAAEAAYDDIERRLGYARRDIIVYGKSLGSAVATYLAWQRPGSGALVLVSAIESVYRVEFDIDTTLYGDIMATIDMIRRQPSPTQLVHGRLDDVAVPRHAYRLYAALRERSAAATTYPVCWLARATHSFEEASSPVDDGQYTESFDELVACLRAGVMRLFDDDDDDDEPPRRRRL